jgi:hypothetical protein
MTQLGFDDLLSQTETDNEVHALKRQYPDLPSGFWHNLLECTFSRSLAADFAREVLRFLFINENRRLPNAQYPGGEIQDAKRDLAAQERPSVFHASLGRAL